MKQKWLSFSSGGRFLFFGDIIFYFVKESKQGI